MPRFESYTEPQTFESTDSPGPHVLKGWNLVPSGATIVGHVHNHPAARPKFSTHLGGDLDMMRDERNQKINPRLAYYIIGDEDKQNKSSISVAVRRNGDRNKNDPFLQDPSTTETPIALDVEADEPDLTDYFLGDEHEDGLSPRQELEAISDWEQSPFKTPGYSNPMPYLQRSSEMDDPSDDYLQCPEWP